MEIAGYIAAVLIGVSLGLLGSGGSILSLPALIFFFGLEPILATTYSLFIVGVPAIVGSVKQMFAGNIVWKKLFLFGIRSSLGVVVARSFVLPRIPENILLASLSIKRGDLLLFLFSLLMLAAAILLLRNNKGARTQRTSARILLLLGFLIGFTAGFLGAGGGFLIVPALLFFGGLTFKEATAMSLTLVGVQCLVGFIADLSQMQIPDLQLLITFTILTLAGMLIGLRFQSRADVFFLKKILALIILLIGLVLLLNLFFSF